MSLFPVLFERLFAFILDLCSTLFFIIPYVIYLLNVLQRSHNTTKLMCHETGSPRVMLKQDLLIEGTHISLIMYLVTSVALSICHF